MFICDFKDWFIREQGTHQKIPKVQELYDFMDKRFGQHKEKGWFNVDFVKIQEENLMETLENY